MVQLMFRAGLIATLCSAFILAQPTPVALVGGRVLTGTGAVHDPGVVIVHQGRIAAVGPANTPIPDTATRRDVSGRWIIPGLVDTHSHIGEVSYGESSAPIQPELRVLDMVNVRSPSIRRAQAGGVTTANVMSGSGLLVSGQTLYLKLRPGNRIDALLITNAAGRIAGGLKMANGTNPRRDPPFPGSRAKSAALVRERFVAAREYLDKIRRAGGDADKLPPRDLGLEILAESLEGQRVVHFHTHRHDDILTVLRLQREFGFRPVLHHVTEGQTVAADIAAAGVPCSIILVDSPGGKLEAQHLDWHNGAALYEAGVPISIHTDDPITDSRFLLRSAAFAVRAGLPPAIALQAVTLNAARQLDLQDRLGSLEPGKDADLVVLSGDPFSVYSHVLETWTEGVKVFDRANPDDRVFATGGPGAGQPVAPGLCCFEVTQEAP